MQAPVTQATGPRPNPPTWPGISGVSAVSTAHGRSGRGWGRSRPTAGVSRRGCGGRTRRPRGPCRGPPRTARPARRPARAAPSGTSTSGLSTSSQRLLATRQPALTPTANPPLSSRTISRTPGRGRAKLPGDRPLRRVIDDHDLADARRDLGRRGQLLDEPEDVGPAVVIDDDDRQQRAANGSRPRLGDLKSLHAFDLMGSGADRFGSSFTEITGIRRRFGRWKSLREIRGGLPRMDRPLVESVGVEPGLGPESRRPRARHRWIGANPCTILSN